MYKYVCLEKQNHGIRIHWVEISFCLSLSFSHPFFSIDQRKPLSSRLWTCLQHHWRSCWQHTELNTHTNLCKAGGWALSCCWPCSVQPGTVSDGWRLTGARPCHSPGGWALVSAGCSATPVNEALGELFLPARSLPAEPGSVLNRASHVTLESACQPSPCSQHFVPHTSLQDVSCSLSLVGGAAASLRESVYQTPWGSLEENHEKLIFVAQEQVCQTKAWW